MGDCNRMKLAEFRMKNPPLSRTINNNYVVAFPVMSLIDDDPLYWHCFVNGFELKATFKTADALWENADFIEPDYMRSPHVDARFFMVPVQQIDGVSR